MFPFIINLHRVLNYIKGFNAGYSTSIGNKMIIEYEGKTYFAKFEERPENESMFDINDNIFTKLKNWE